MNISFLNFDVMINFKFLTVFLIAITFQSCFKDDGDPLPTSGENSFSVKLNGEQFVAEDVWKFTSIYYGITAYVNNKSWLLRFSNSSDRTIIIYLHEVEEVGFYDVGTNDYLFPESETAISSIIVRTGNLDIEYHTNFPELKEKIEITKIEGDSIIIGKFEKITLSDAGNPDKKIILTDGKFNINRATLNKNDL